MTKRKLTAVLFSIAILAIAWLRFSPLPEGFLDTSHNDATVIVDRNGAVLYDGLSDAGVRSTKIDADAIPPHVIATTLAAEDKRFFMHPGVDPIAVARAAWQNIRYGRVVEGGSTITQQTVKLLLSRGGAPPSRSLTHKAREAVLALQLESRLSKREILGLYLNVAPYGNQIAGLERASASYFGMKAADLTLAQAAFLAGLPQKPGALNPYRNFKGATERKDAVLGRLDRDEIAAETLSAAKRERVRLVPRSSSLLAPHFVFALNEELGEQRPPRVMSTLDSELQRAVRGIIDAQRPRLDRHGAHNVAVVVLHNQSGEWLAWEGSGDYFDASYGGAIDGVRARRQPGSTLKPFAYAAAFERGLDPSTVLPDVPASFATADPGVLYTPRNYDGKFRGPILARNALAGSVNVPAVWLTAQSGPAALLRLLRAAGIDTLAHSADYYGLGIILGDGEVTLEQLVAAYSVFARGGTYRQPRLIREQSRDAQRASGTLSAASANSGGDEKGTGRALRVPTKERQVVSARTAFLITDVLDDDDAREFAFGRGNSLELPFPAAVKTGTSQAYHDNWTVGYTRDVTVGVWVGNFDRKPLRNSSGVTGAAPIFHAVMLEAQKRYGAPNEEIVPRPDTVLQQRICLLSGLRATIACPRVGSEWGAGAKGCDWHILSHDGTKQVTRTAWPVRYRAWAESAGMVETADLQAARSDEPAKPMRIVSPSDGVVFLADPTLRREFQTAKLKASVRGATRVVDWHVDGKFFKRAGSDAEVRWPLRVGQHVIEAKDERGNVDQVQVTVK